MSGRIPIIAGNWKMYTTARTAGTLCRSLRKRIDDLAGVEKVVCPPFVFLAHAKRALGGSSIKVGAQNVYWEEEGAYTGEVSPAMLADLCEYVIVGHSERRKYFGETDETVNRRLKAALAHGLRPSCAWARRWRSARPVAGKRCCCGRCEEAWRAWICP